MISFDQLIALFGLFSRRLFLFGQRVSFLKLVSDMRLLAGILVTLAVSLPLEAGRPNVLFIAVDDLKPTIGCYGYTQAMTPNFDKLASAGTTFLNAHCQQALCGPSRVSLLTGYYPDTLGIYGMGSERYKLRSKYPDILTLPQHFKNSGYVVIGTGKIFDPRNVEGDWKGPQDAISWTRFFGGKQFNSETGGPKYGGRYHDPTVGALSTRLYKEGKGNGLIGKALREYVRNNGGGPAVECYDVPDDAYGDGAIANWGIEQLEELKDSRQAFFLAVGFEKPHLPFVAPEKYWNLYDRDQLELEPVQQYPQGAPAVAETDYVEARTYSGIPAEGVIPESIQRELLHGYLACVSYVDAQVGRLIDKLVSTGLAQDTIVVFWGDHGFHLGDKAIWGKHTNYEQSTRSPLIISNVGRRGQKTDGPVNLLDIFPTLCELIGLDTPVGLDGKSLVPILEGSAKSVRNYAASIYGHSGHWGIATRTERYRYVSWYKAVQNKGWQGNRYLETPEFVELYDYVEDPHEQVNLSGLAEYADIEISLADQNREHVRYTQGRQFKIK
ncbi:MAG: hypothetical protein CBC33_008555 [Coraliomargarita sp. TMED73]|nr:MAG: hypothetical protein CBC33_008555 [Coraliomargarita sp. TMED73]|tara:strand:+ start:2430 stop:4091 length:1662 start_codon:yes stop_codon:yes gene_type:complete